MATALCLCLYGRAVNETLRWHWRIELTDDTNERYQAPLEQRIINNDTRCARFPGVQRGYCRTTKKLLEQIAKALSSPYRRRSPFNELPDFSKCFCS